MTRSLPIRTPLLPGEAIDSWLAANAARMKCTWSDMLSAVSPRTSDDQHLRVGMHLLWGALSPSERASLSRATGVSFARLDAATLAGVIGEPVVIVDPVSRKVNTPWGRVDRQRFCPMCLRAAGGRFKLEWRLPWTCACIEHGCLLEDECPKCERTQLVTPRWFCNPYVPQADRCRYAISDTRSHPRCSAPLSKAQIRSLSAFRPILPYQSTLRELRQCDTYAEGIYSVAPVDAGRLFADIRGLAERILRTSSLDRVLTLIGIRASRDSLSRWCTWLGTEVPGDLPDRYRLNQSSCSAAVMLGTAAALNVIMRPSIDDAGRALRQVTSEKPPQLQYERNANTRPSKAITAIEIVSRSNKFSILDEFRYRTISPLPRLPETQRFARHHALVSAVPTLIWPQCAVRLCTGKLRWNTEREVLARLLLTIGSVMPAPDLERELLSKLDQHRATVATNKMRSHPNWVGITSALLRLHEYLSESPPPIDYQRRRRLDYTALLSDTQWTAISQSRGRSEVSAMAVRRWLCERLGGAPDSMSRYKAHRQRCDSEEDEVRAILNEQRIAELDGIALKFMAANGVDGEPLLWAPPPTLFDGLDLPGTSFANTDLDVIGALLEKGRTVEAIAYKLKAPIWKVRYQIDLHPTSAGTPAAATACLERKRPARSIRRTLEERLPEATLRDLYERKHMSFIDIGRCITPNGSDVYVCNQVSRLARGYGIVAPVRRRTDITEAWMYEQHIMRGRSLRDLAAELGVTYGLLRKRRRTCGLEPDAPTKAVLEALSMDPCKFSTPARRVRAWSAMKRFVKTSEYATYKAAAEAQGWNAAALGGQIRSLEARLGLRLIECPGHQRRPLSLTVAGKTLAHLVSSLDSDTQVAIGT